MTGDDSRVDLLSKDDDAFHRPTGARWFHETAWFWFFVPDARLGGWLYSWVRPNVGVSGGGCWVWDDSSASHLEVPYYANHSNLPLPEAAPLGGMHFPNGIQIDTIEPLCSYRLAYADREEIDLQLQFDAVMPPWVPPDALEAHHFDQVGRIHGSLVLHGRHHEVDCLAIRDRTWTTRSERWRVGSIGYSNAANSTTAFLATASDRIVGGYLVADGHRAALVDGERRVVRDPASGHINELEVSARDRLGRELVAHGRSVSRMAMPVPGVHGIVWTSLVDWTINGEQAWGEDQDAWPIEGWSRFRRNQELMKNDE